MGKDLNVNNLDEETRKELERIQKERGFSTLTGFLKVALKEYIEYYRKKSIDKMSGFQDNV